MKLGDILADAQAIMRILVNVIDLLIGSNHVSPQPIQFVTHGARTILIRTRDALFMPSSGLVGGRRSVHKRLPRAPTDRHDHDRVARTSGHPVVKYL